MERIIIDLAAHVEKGVGVLAGQHEGKALRERFNLDRVDALPKDEAVDGLVTVIIPGFVYSFNSSYFLGLLAPSVVTLGPEEFRRRYRLTGPDAEGVTQRGIRVSMLTSTPITSLRSSIRK